MSLISGSFLVVKDLRFFSPGFQYYDLNKTHAYKQVISDPLVYFQQIFFSTPLFCTKHVLKYLFPLPFFFYWFQVLDFSSAASSGGPLKAFIIISSLLPAVLSLWPFLWETYKFLTFAYSPKRQDQEWKPQLAGGCLGLQSGSGQAGEGTRHLLLLLLLSISCSLSYTEIQGKRKSPLHVKSTFGFFHERSINS